MAVASLQTKLENLWYQPQKPWWLWLFLPFQLLLLLIVFLRHSFYRLGFFKSNKLKVPVVVIGNINVGGTGKTPLAIHLLKLLQARGYKPGLVTRGYGGNAQQFPLLIDKTTPASLAGDEPILIYANSQSPVVVDPVRTRGAKALIKQADCNIILCDDGLQHYALQRDVELLVIDATRGFGNGWLMPFGPLREPISRSKKCDFSVVNGKSMQLKLKPIISVVSREPLDLNTIQTSIHAVAGIGNPQRFFDSLSKLDLSFSQQAFADHHPFKAADFSGMDGIIIMTEKDAVKCKDFADERFYYLPVEASLDKSLEQAIMTKINALVANN